MSRREYYIYCHSAPNGKRYIGQTCQKPEVRWSHGYGYRGQQHFFRAVQKYGWDNFEHVVLCSVSSKENADFLEQYFIEKYDTFNPEHGYNHTKGGGGCLGHKASAETLEKLSKAAKGRVLSDEHRKKVSESLKRGYASGEIPLPTMSEEARARLSKERTGEGNPMYGKHHTKEARARIGDGHRGKKHSSEWKQNISSGRYASEKICRRAVCQFTVDGVLVAEYRSIKEAADAVGTVPQNIRGSCLHESWHCSGYLWRFQDSPETFPPQQMGLFY